MNAIILAGGFGSRLKPLTDNIPKPMLSVANAPMIDYCVAHLLAVGIKNMVFTLGYYPQQIINWVEGYRDVTSIFSVEDLPLGTAGGVKNAEKYLDDDFIVISGDALENINLPDMISAHYSSGAAVTMAVTRVDEPSLYGVLETNASGIITKFIEKPQKGETNSNLINCGIYIINKKALKLVPEGAKFDFSRDLFPMLLNRGELKAFVHNGYWSDIGDIRSYYHSNFDMTGGGFFAPPANCRRDNNLSYLTSGLSANMLSYNSSVVGQCRNSIVGNNSVIASGASVDNCIILDNTVVTKRYINSIIGQNLTITVVPDKIGLNLQNIPEFSNIFS